MLSKKKSEIIKSIILYRASDHGWQPEDFHSKCDNNGPTISLFKSKQGDCFGGYTSKNWQSFPKGETLIDKEAFLFNLNYNRIFPSKNTGTEVYSAKYMGPSFSANYGNELSAYLSPFNGERHCRSYANNPTY